MLRSRIGSGCLCALLFSSLAVECDTVAQDRPSIRLFSCERIEVANQAITGLAISKSGESVYASTQSGTVYSISSKNLKKEAFLSIKDPINSLRLQKQKLIVSTTRGIFCHPTTNGNDVSYAIKPEKGDIFDASFLGEKIYFLSEHGFYEFVQNKLTLISDTAEAFNVSPDQESLCFSEGRTQLNFINQEADSTKTKIEDSPGTAVSFIRLMNGSDGLAVIFGYRTFSETMFSSVRNGMPRRLRSIGDRKMSCCDFLTKKWLISAGSSIVATSVEKDESVVILEPPEDSKFVKSSLTPNPVYFTTITVQQVMETGVAFVGTVEGDVFKLILKIEQP